MHLMTHTPIFLPEETPEEMGKDCIWIQIWNECDITFHSGVCLDKHSVYVVENVCTRGCHYETQSLHGHVYDLHSAIKYVLIGL